MISSERMIIDLLEFVAKELDRYGKIVNNHEWTEGPDAHRVKDYLYNNKYYTVKRTNGSISSILIGGDLNE